MRSTCAGHASRPPPSPSWAAARLPSWVARNESPTAASVRHPDGRRHTLRPVRVGAPSSERGRNLHQTAPVRNPRAIRVLLAYAAIGVGWVGPWATLAPRSFYDSFPGGGHQWVSPDGPYNEHLVRDVGELNLALLVVLVAAIVWMTRPLILTAAAALITYYLPHFIYHAAHTDPFSASDATAELVSLASNVVVGAVIIALVLRPAARPASERAQAAA